MSKKLTRVPLPTDLFDEEEPFELEDTQGYEIECDIVDTDWDEDGADEDTYNILYFCEWFGCTVLNAEVCKQCGIFWLYFSTGEH